MHSQYDIICDENMPKYIIQALRDQWYSVLSIWESKRGISDIEICAMLADQSSLLITMDKDFWDLLRFHGKTIWKSSILLLRSENQLSLSTLLKYLVDHIWSKKLYIVVNNSKVRINTLL